MFPVFNWCEDTAVKVGRSPLDFCRWGCMKSKVYKEKANTRDEWSLAL